MLRQSISQCSEKWFPKLRFVDNVCQDFRKYVTKKRCSHKVWTSHYFDQNVKITYRSAAEFTENGILRIRKTMQVTHTNVASKKLHLMRWALIYLNLNNRKTVSDTNSDLDLQVTLTLPLTSFPFPNFAVRHIYEG